MRSKTSPCMFGFLRDIHDRTVGDLAAVVVMSRPLLPGASAVHLLSGIRRRKIQTYFPVPGTKYAPEGAVRAPCKGWVAATGLEPVT